MWPSAPLQSLSPELFDQTGVDLDASMPGGGAMLFVLTDARDLSTAVSALIVGATRTSANSATALRANLARSPSPALAGLSAGALG